MLHSLWHESLIHDRHPPFHAKLHTAACGSCAFLRLRRRPAARRRECLCASHEITRAGGRLRNQITFRSVIEIIVLLKELQTWRIPAGILLLFLTKTFFFPVVAFAIQPQVSGIRCRVSVTGFYRYLAPDTDTFLNYFFQALSSWRWWLVSAFARAGIGMGRWHEQQRSAMS